LTLHAKYVLASFCYHEAMSPGTIPAVRSPPPASPAPARAAAPQNSASAELGKEAQAQLDKLKARDTEVRQHEMAHLSAAGGLATSGPSYTYQRGPNGVNYAIGGEVNIDTSPGGSPEETLSRAQTIQAAALAPASPSGADRAVAARGSQMEQEARAEITARQQEVSRAYGQAQPAARILDLFA
jgi:hypothetical protein